MSSTVDEIIAKFRVRYPDCSVAFAQSLFADSHRRLLTRVSVRNGVVLLNLVALQPEYALDSSVFKVHSGYYRVSADIQWPLTERSTSELDVERWGWRMNRPIGQPNEFYITTEAVSDSAENAIGFPTIPGTTTSAGYPVVALYCTQWAALSGAETVPTNLLDDNYYLYDMFAKWCALNDPSQSEYWEGKAEVQINLNHEHVQNLQAQGTSGFFPTSAYMPTRSV